MNKKIRSKSLSLKVISIFIYTFYILTNSYSQVNNTDNINLPPIPFESGALLPPIPFDHGVSVESGDFNNLGALLPPIPTNSEVVLPPIPEACDKINKFFGEETSIENGLIEYHGSGDKFVFLKQSKDMFYSRTIPIEGNILILDNDFVNGTENFNIDNPNQKYLITKIEPCMVQIELVSVPETDGVLVDIECENKDTINSLFNNEDSITVNLIIYDSLDEKFIMSRKDPKVILELTKEQIIDDNNNLNISNNDKDARHIRYKAFGVGSKRYFNVIKVEGDPCKVKIELVEEEVAQPEPTQAVVDENCQKIDTFFGEGSSELILEDFGDFDNENVYFINNLDQFNKFEIDTDTGKAMDTNEQTELDKVMLIINPSSISNLTDFISNIDVNNLPEDSKFKLTKLDDCKLHLDLANDTDTEPTQPFVDENCEEVKSLFRNVEGNSFETSVITYIDGAYHIREELKRTNPINAAGVFSQQQVVNHNDIKDLFDVDGNPTRDANDNSPRFKVSRENAESCEITIILVEDEAQEEPTKPEVDENCVKINILFENYEETKFETTEVMVTINDYDNNTVGYVYNISSNNDNIELLNKYVQLELNDILLTDVFENNAIDLKKGIDANGNEYPLHKFIVSKIEDCKIQIEVLNNVIVDNSGEGEPEQPTPDLQKRGSQPKPDVHVCGNGCGCSFVR